MLKFLDKGYYFLCVITAMLIMKPKLKYEFLIRPTIFLSIALLSACGGGGSSGGGASKSIMPSASALKGSGPSRIADGRYTLFGVFDQVSDRENCTAVDRDQREKSQVITLTVEGNTCTVISFDTPDKAVFDLKEVRGRELACKVSEKSIVVDTRFTTQVGNGCSATIHEVLRADVNNGQVANDCQTEDFSQDRALFNANAVDDAATYVGCVGFENHYSSKCDEALRSQNDCQYLASIVMVPVDDGTENYTDGDGFPDDQDNCPDITNPSQADKDGDFIGDACDQTLAEDLLCKNSWQCPQGQHCLNGMCLPAEYDPDQRKICLGSQQCALGQTCENGRCTGADPGRLNFF